MPSGRTARRRSSTSARSAPTGARCISSRPPSVARFSPDMRRLASVVLCLALGAAGCGERSSALPTATAKPVAVSETRPPAVTMVSPEYRMRHTALETSGKMMFNEEALVRINAIVTGRVLEVLARPGDAVDPGTRLLVVDSSDLGLAKADYAKAVADVERAEAALKLARELFEVKAIAAKEIRDGENEHRRTMAERERASSRLLTLGIRRDQFADIAARKDVSTTVVITAPRPGVVVERNVTPGQVVAYGQSDTPVSLFVIADLSTMWVLADVYEPDVASVKIGQTMTVRLACCPSPSRPCTGRTARCTSSWRRERTPTSAGPSRSAPTSMVAPSRSSAASPRTTGS